MRTKLKEVKYQGDYRVWLRFDDGLEGEVNHESELWGEVFEPLKQKDFFEKFNLDKDLDTIVWANGDYFTPEFLYRQFHPE